MYTARGVLYAGVVTYPDGTKGILAAGGLGINSAEFLNLDSMTWEPKKNLPTNISHGRSVPYKESFLIVSGLTSNGYHDSIYYFDPVTDDWDLLPQTVNTGTGIFEAYLIPDYFEDCL